MHTTHFSQVNNYQVGSKEFHLPSSILLEFSKNSSERYLIQFPGAIYQILLSLPWGSDTRRSVEKLGFWFAPEKFPVSMGINIRNTIFGFGGRVLFNYLTNPARTETEIRTTTSEELWDRMTSANYLATWTGRIVWQALSALSGIAILYAIGASRDSLYGRSFTYNSPLDDLNNSVQNSLFQMF